MKRFVILLVVVALVVIVWSSAWLFGSQTINRAIASQANGAPRITCGDVAVAGFPFRFDITCTDFVAEENDISVKMPEIKITALVYRPTHIIAFMTGPATIADAFAGSQNRVDWTSLEASVRTEWLKPSRFSLLGEELALTDTLFGDQLIASAENIGAHLVDAGGVQVADQMNASFFAQLTNGDIPAVQTQNIDATIESLVTSLPDDIRLWASPRFARLWQSMGGVASLGKFQILAPNLTTNLTGEVRLDGQGLVNGDLLLASTGLAERVEDLIPRPYGSLVLGTEKPDGSYAQNLSITSGVVTVGFIPFLQLAPMF